MCYIHTWACVPQKQSWGKGLHVSSLLWQMRLGTVREHREGSQFKGVLSRWLSVDNWGSVLPRSCAACLRTDHSKKWRWKDSSTCYHLLVRMAEGTPTCAPQDGSEETAMLDSKGKWCNGGEEQVASAMVGGKKAGLKDVRWDTRGMQHTVFRHRFHNKKN